MNELRKDYILNRYVIIATDRAKRPDQFKQKKEKTKKGTCFFCPGNEHLTPPEIDRIEKGKKWLIRCFPNKFPATKPRGNPIIRTDNTFFTFSDAVGKHEVIAETPDHSKQLADLPVSHIKLVLQMYIKRINEISQISGIAYVTIFKNQGEESGSSLPHTHTQIIALNKVPKTIQEETDTSKNYPTCPYCDILNIEKNSYRRIKENDTFVSFTPYASRFPFEAWIFPKRHTTSITELTEQELIDLAAQLKHILKKLKKLNAPYNFYIHNAPKDQDLHFHIEIAPRLSLFGGFELGTDDIINVMSPEEAAKFYRK